MLAVVGNSYIEAWFIPYGETVQGRLAEALKGRVRVYSFAGSAAPLSQYLIWARHAVHDYGATALVINVEGNDFDRSLAKYWIWPGYWHYVPDAERELHLRLFERHPSLVGTIVKSSAVGRYLAYQLDLVQFFIQPHGPESGVSTNLKPAFAGNTSTDTSSERVDDSLMAVDAFFRDLPELVGLPPERVLFTMDGMRYPDVAAAAAGSYFDVMRRAFRAKATALGYEVIDLDDWFFTRYRQTGERFAFARDNHWNAAGHALVAEAVLASKLVRHLDQDTPAPARSDLPGQAGPRASAR
jgi:hypothetical protein